MHWKNEAQKIQNLMDPDRRKKARTITDNGDGKYSRFIEGCGHVYWDGKVLKCSNISFVLDTNTVHVEGESISPSTLYHFLRLVEYSGHSLSSKGAFAPYDGTFNFPQLVERGWETGEQVSLRFSSEHSESIHLNSRKLHVELWLLLENKFDGSVRQFERLNARWSGTKRHYAQWLLDEEIDAYGNYFSNAFKWTDSPEVIKDGITRVLGRVAWCQQLGGDIPEKLLKKHEVSSTALEHVKAFIADPTTPACSKCLSLDWNDMKNIIILSMHQRYGDEMALVNTDVLDHHFTDYKPSEWQKIEKAVCEAKDDGDVRHIVEELFKKNNGYFHIGSPFKSKEEFTRVVKGPFGHEKKVRVNTRALLDFAAEHVVPLIPCKCDSCQKSYKLWLAKRVAASLMTGGKDEKFFKCVRCGSTIHNHGLAMQAAEKSEELGITVRALCCSCYSKSHVIPYEQRVNQTRTT